MSYIIISNIGLAIMILILYLRYAHFRLTLKSKLEEQKKLYDQKLSEVKTVEVQADPQLSKAETEKLEKLTKDYQELEKQKESENKLRLNAEKQIEVANKKMVDLQSRIEDWSVIQDALLNDSRDTIVKIGNDLFKKLNDSYKQETLTNRNMISRIPKTIEEQREVTINAIVTNVVNNVVNAVVGNVVTNFNNKFSEMKITLDEIKSDNAKRISSANVQEQKSMLENLKSTESKPSSPKESVEEPANPKPANSDNVATTPTQAPANAENAQANTTTPAPSQDQTVNNGKGLGVSDPNTKKLLGDILETMKAAGRLSNKDFFLASNLDENRAKFMLCELAFASAEITYLIDFKSIKFFSEFEVNSAKNADEATKILKEKLAKYHAYLSNPKYVESVSTVLNSLKVVKEKKVIIFALSSKKEIALLKDYGLYDKIKQSGIEIMDFDLIVNLII